MEYIEFGVDARRGINVLDLEVTLWKRVGDTCFVAKPWVLEFEKVDVGSVVKPSMVIPYQMQGKLLKEILKVIDQQGLKLDTDLKMEGELKATKYHLEDMRKLLKVR